MVSGKEATPKSVDNTSPNPAYESSTIHQQDGDTDVIYEHISKQADSVGHYIINILPHIPTSGYW